MKPARPLALCAALAVLCLASNASADTPAVSMTYAKPGPRVAKVLEHTSKAQYFGGVAISPDGSRLAWTTSTRDGSRVQLADADGNHVRTVQMANAFKGCSEGRASWSPDGSELAFLSNCGNPENQAQNDIYLVDAASLELCRIQRTSLQPNAPTAVTL